jgi:hypothetical protein
MAEACHGRLMVHAISIGIGIGGGGGGGDGYFGGGGGGCCGGGGGGDGSGGGGGGGGGDGGGDSMAVRRHVYRRRQSLWRPQDRARGRVRRVASCQASVLPSARAIVTAAHAKAREEPDEPDDAEGCGDAAAGLDLMVRTSVLVGQKGDGRFGRRSVRRRRWRRHRCSMRRWYAKAV